MRAKIRLGLVAGLITPNIGHVDYYVHFYLENNSSEGGSDRQ